MSDRDSAPRRSKARRCINWPAIEREYRAGLLPVAVIARWHGIHRTTVHDKAKERGWSRDLEGAVRKRISTRLAAPRPVETAEPESSALDPVEVAAERAIHVVRSHRADIARLRRIAEGLARRVEDTLAETDDGAATVGGREGLDAALVRLAQVTARIITLERLAFGLDERPRHGGATPTQDGAVDERSDEDKRRELAELVGIALDPGAPPRA